MTGATKFQNDDTHEYLKQVCILMQDYASEMLCAGSISQRIEESIHRVADCYDVEADVSILPKRVLVAIWTKDHRHQYNSVGHTLNHGVNYTTACALEEFSIELERNPLSIDEAKRRVGEIVCEKRHNRWLVIILTGLANASFCRLFDGDGIAMLIVLTATIDGFYLKQKMLSVHIDGRLTTLACAFVSATIGASGIIFGWSETPDTALATSVLYLVPGIPLLNAMGDMLSSHHLCALSRLSEAVITTVCLSLGLCATLLLTHIGW